MKSQQLTWLVVFDSTICRLYEYSKNNLVLVKQIEHSENKLKDIDITSDKPGRYQSSAHAHGTYSQESDPKEIQIERFSKEITKMLEHGNSVNAYEKLILVSSPHMHGLLLKNLNKQVEKLIAHVISKDLVHFSEADLLNYVNNELKLD
ncbi:host attachment protein [Legionella tunisiensis]|uniref:host attachment protein n=1 Tax=Legionella tunisiensis TaxID=1034944 RepID=UPI0002E4B51D|nr:host attachment protein [Legionella tunisiensis]